MSMRITNLMISGRDAARPQRRLDTASPRPQHAAVVGQADHAPVRRPVRHEPRADPARRARRRTHSTSATSATAWLAAHHRRRRSRISTTSLQRARELLVQGGNDTAGQSDAHAIADEIDQLIEQRQAAGQRHYGGQLRLLRHRDRHRALRRSAAPTPTRRHRHDRRARSAPASRCQLERATCDMLGDGQTASDGKLLTRPARHRHAPARRHRRRRERAAHDRPPGTRRQPRRRSTHRAPTVGARTNRLEPPAAACRTRAADLHREAAVRRRGRRHGADDLHVLDAAGRLPGSAAGAGANIVQQSLLDFLGRR